MIVDDKKFLYFIRKLGKEKLCQATGGNFSYLESRDPFRIKISKSGCDKAKISIQDLLTIDQNEGILEGIGSVSAETKIHLVIYNNIPCKSIFHVHSIYNTILSDFFLNDGQLEIEGYEMLKGLKNNKSHEMKETIPILKNSQDIYTLSQEINLLFNNISNPIHGILLSGHGLYTWGDSFEETFRHVQTFEFLLECVYKKMILIK